MKFDSYHPAINFIFFLLMISMSAYFNQPVFLVITFVCPFVYSIKLIGMRAFVFNIILIPFIVVYSLIYSGYHHFGITDLSVNFIGNKITLESVVSGMVIGIIVASILMWIACIHKIITCDKVIYLFGRVSPKLSLFLSILFRAVPRIKVQAKKINMAQKCIGKGINQGNIFVRCYNFIRLVSIVIAWTMENFVETSDSMRSRGCSLKGRTAFSIYRFDYRDRSVVIWMFSLVSIILAGIVLDQTRILYNPEIILNKITPLSNVFYLAYFLLCMLPFYLQLYSEIRWEKYNNKI